jgi:hypothetical protein
MPTEIEHGHNGSQGSTRRMLKLREYADHVGVHERTVKRWLRDEQLPGATKDPFSGDWMIPADTMRVKTSPMAGHVDQPLSPSGELQIHRVEPGYGVVPYENELEVEPTRLQALDEEPAFMSVADAAFYLGIPQAQILANPDRFQVEHLGYNSSPRVPKSVIKKIEG